MGGPLITYTTEPQTALVALYFLVHASAVLRYRQGYGLRTCGYTENPGGALYGRSKVN